METKMELAATIAQTAIDKGVWTNEAGTEFLKWAETQEFYTIRILADNYKFMQEDV